MSSVDISPLLTSSLDNELYPRSDWPPGKKKEEKTPSAAALVRTTATRGSILGLGFTLEIFLDTFQCQALFC